MGDINNSNINNKGETNMKKIGIALLVLLFGVGIIVLVLEKMGKED